ncbi:MULTISPECIES: hypothetical protein [unclassified Kitasatospora]|uniref:hypothetical protein n=1 Tax=unclassified Kitasatospora TaxID=2633591 RepID=UPI0033F3125E
MPTVLQHAVLITAAGAAWAALAVFAAAITAITAVTARSDARRRDAREVLKVLVRRSR